MLELRNITKIYKVGDFEQRALDDVNVSFRENEFVSILGPSGSGKTTMLNIIGGLDQYTSGDLIINGVSTKDFKDKDWDSYRNHRIGFVFQSYNLIPHQSILANVELALTLSGVSKKARIKRAKEALIKVGLEEHIHKRPNQLSGGQMQRVAIARALVNNPDILLADEPTGALDTEISKQIMDLLKEIAKDKLVIMVTHNPELANEYSTRIVKVLDGNVIDDTDPFDGNVRKENKNVTKRKSRKTSMNFKTALSLSLNNLMTKMGRTVLTAFAGSIGIIGIALILSLSSGVQNYIDKVQQDTLSSYPLSITSATMDASSMMASSLVSKDETNHDLDKVYSNNIMTTMMDAMTAGIRINKLKEFKAYLEDSDIKNYVNDIKYSYNVDLTLYKPDTTKIVQVSPVTVFESLGLGEMSNMSMGDSQVWSELTDNRELLKSQYDVVAGRFPKSYDEVVMILDENNEISDYALYAIGLKDQQELQKMLMDSIQGGEFVVEETEYSYDEILDLKFKLVLNNKLYAKENGIWVNKKDDNEYMKNIINNSLDIKIVGIIKANEEANIMETTGGMAYTSDLIKYIVNENNNSLIVSEQKANDTFDITTNVPFSSVYTKNMALTNLGSVDIEDPSMINIYPKDFEAKEEVERIIKEYNDLQIKNDLEDNTIEYTDYVGLLMSSVTTIVDIIGYVLIAFVSISLVVSSIMIGIITYISVLERTKEIGILRAIGASKKDISRVFNAETFIVGLFAGLIGIGVTILLNIPINMIIKSITGISDISSLPVMGGVILVLISMILTVIAGLIPSSVASRKDPVEALRSE